MRLEPDEGAALLGRLALLLVRRAVAPLLCVGLLVLGGAMVRRPRRRR